MSRSSHLGQFDITRVPLPTTLSHPDTFVYKFVVGGMLGIALPVSLLTLSVFRGQLVFAVLMSTAAVWFARTQMWPLKRLVAHEMWLEVSNWCISRRIPWHDILEVSEIAHTHRLTRITLRRNYGFGSVILYMPCSVRTSVTWEPHPANVFIQRKANADAMCAARGQGALQDPNERERVRLSTSATVFLKVLFGPAAIGGLVLWLFLGPIPTEYWIAILSAGIAAVLWFACRALWPLKTVVAYPNYIEVSSLFAHTQVRYGDVQEVIETPYFGRTTRIVLKEPCEFGKTILYRPYMMPSLWLGRWCGRHPANRLLEQRVHESR